MTIRPDEAMGKLYPPVTSVPRLEAAPGPGAGAELDISARLVATLDGVSDAARQLAASRTRDQLSWEDCHPIDIAALQTPGGAAGFITDERWQPREKWAWQVLLITVTFGAGGTSAVLYQTASAEGTVANNSLKSFIPDAASTAVWEPKGLILLPGHQLGLQAAGGGATLRGKAVEIYLPRLPEYLM